jgi:hypothetical protein
MALASPLAVFAAVFTTAPASAASNSTCSTHDTCNTLNVSTTSAHVLPVSLSGRDEVRLRIIDANNGKAIYTGSGNVNEWLGNVYSSYYAYIYCASNSGCSNTATLWLANN